MSFIDGNIRQYLFYNEDNSYSVLKVEIIDTDEPELAHYEPTIVICGFFPRLEPYQNYRFYGNLTEHPKYGMQYDASRFERVKEKTASGIIEYLSSDIFKGIGPKIATGIVEALGTDALEKIVADKTVLDGIPRLNEQKKEMIYSSIKKNRNMESAMVWLYGFSISPKMASKIYQKLGYDAISIVENDPYRLIDEIEGVGFRRADEIALKIGFSYDDPRRIEAVIVFLLTEYMNKYGDTFLTEDDLVDFTISYQNQGTNFHVDGEIIREHLERLESAKKLVLDQNNVSLAGIYYSEKGIAASLGGYFESSPEEANEETLEGYIRAFEQSRDIAYTPKQKKAVVKALTDNCTIITGGPGTGKTTIIDAICHVFMMMRQHKKNPASEIRLVAPTGKAAKRLQDATGLEATTIHRLLGYNYEGKFTKSAHDKIEASLVIVDEASMMDVILAYHLFRALPDKAKLVIVGDDDQLPSVGPGQVLADMIASDCFTTVKLDEIHRQAGDSGIVGLAYAVLEQNVRQEMFVDHDDLAFYSVPEEKIADFIIGLIRRYVREGYSLMDDIQVLAPVYKGRNGIDAVNKLIQETFNRQNEAHKICFGDKTFRFGDKVMQLVNQPEDGIMNGDIGVVAKIIEDKEMIVDYNGNPVKYNIKDFDNLTLAYCISIHKSQGSEFNIVLMPIAKSYRIMLKKKLIYTGITRAKQQLFLIGDREAFRMGIYGKEKPRKTRLREFLVAEATRGKDTPNLSIADFL